MSNFLKKTNKVFLIGEIGINHNGDVKIAKKIIKNAKLAGFDAVKFQKREIDLVYSEEILNEPRNSPWGTTQRDQKKGLELNLSEYEQIDNYCKKKNIEWFASAWDIESLKFLDYFENINHHKIASAMIIDKFFLKEVAKRKKHTFISTGMSTKEDIENAVKIFRDHNCSFELMHCVSTYPMKTEDANLQTISTLKRKFDCNVGYSGHENGIAVSLAALMFNISSLERHITLDRTMYGSDQAASLQMKGMTNLVNSINKMLLAVGADKFGNIHPDEVAISKKLRAHIK